ncbi:MAG: zinc-binding dehydrogenase [Nitrospirae bacterium]|nr:zinc-binding dehydrogenase [Nitrospirota bacterium]
MMAVRITRAGGPGVLEVARAPRPEPGPGQVRVRLHAASVNHLDVWLREGKLPVTLPHVPGSDGAGVADALGDGVTGIQPGDRYLILPTLSCGACAVCMAGYGQHCARFGIVGVATPGCYAEYVVVPAANLIPIPHGLDFVQAASFPVAALTAWHLLVTRAAVRAGETVLVHGAGSGLGVHAIQIAKAFGAEVIATAGSGDKCEAAIGLGADAALNHTLGDVAGKVLEMTGGRGVDVVFDHVGADLFTANLRCLAIGGRLLVCGTTTGGEVAFNLRDLFSRQQTIHGGRLGGRRELNDLADLFGRGLLRPVVDTVLPLEKAAEAHRRMEGRAHFGKLMLTMG